MFHEVIPAIGAEQAWRDAARRHLSAQVPPEQIVWGDTSSVPELFGSQPATKSSATVTVPRSFIALANTVVWHNDPQRFAWLYAFLWRVQNAPHLMSDRGDVDLARLRRLEKGVHRCQHKMKAFVRFREIGAPDQARRSFAAWFEPTHHTVEPTASFFARRFGDMDWQIITPDVSVQFQSGALSFQTGQAKPDLPEDASEALWVTYFQNIFNPARLKVQAMQSEMPKKYWKNLPEAATIPELIANAPKRAEEMGRMAPTLPPPRMARVQAQLLNHQSAWDGASGELPQAISKCTRCPLYKHATQPVMGEGPSEAELMIVGEQPGDLEDLQGRPFVGPAGQMFDAVAKDVSLMRDRVYITNAIKHFKFKPKGRRRIHQSPNKSEIEHCRWWLDAEIAQVKPKLILAMGAVAAQAVTGIGANLSKRRGSIQRSLCGTPALLTFHPAYLLRLPDPVAKSKAIAAFRSDLETARDMSRQPTGLQTQ